MGPESVGLLDAYRLISGSMVDLREVPLAARLFINDLAIRLAQGQGHDELVLRVLNPSAPIYSGSSPLAPDTAGLPAVQVARDLVYRAGVAEGVIKPSGPTTEGQVLPAVLGGGRRGVAGGEGESSERLTTVKIVTVGEAMVMLNITRQAVINAVRKGKIRGEQHGRLWILSRDGVVAYGRAREERKR
jgi:hypothetical protein